MPKPRRESGARADARPAFSRPPGAPAPRPTYPTYDNDDDDHESPRRSSPRKDRGDRPRGAQKAKASPAASPADRERRKRRPDRTFSESPTKDRAKYTSGSSADSGSHLLSSNALSKLNAYNEGEKYAAQKKQKTREKQYKNLKAPVEPEQRRRKRKKNRNVSGAILEEGRGGKHHKRRKSEYYEHDEKAEIRARKGGKKRKKWWIIGGVALIALIIIIAVAVAASKSKGKKGDGDSSTSTSTSTNSGPSNKCDGTDVPESAKGDPYTDSSIWADSTDFNCTYTSETVGGLSVMGLNSDWDDSTRANSNVPPLNKQWEYGKMPIRGVIVGGWLSIEPFITPSLFNYPASANVRDEYTLSAKLGSAAARTLESHYASFITAQTFSDIKDAGLDHVRIPYPYWLVATYEGDPYVHGIGWRYLLRAIEYCRQNGLRVNLDLHAVPGSQNGWTHSGRLGSIDWISGPDGATNAQRALDIHNQLSTFFSQPRYANVVTIYGLVNEPKMLVIPHADVLDWNTKAIAIIRGNGIKQYLTFGDGFLALSDWQGQFQGVDDKLILDTHQYQIFNTGQLKLSHSDKIKLACSGWTGLLVASNNPSTGWGPTLNGEWSQADTDCATYLNNVGVGSRWAGTLNLNDLQQGQNVLTPSCPTSPQCDCSQANADPGSYSAEYKQFLQMYAEAQMHSFEQAWGWFYWTWKTETAVQWSWELGLKAGILPGKAYSPDFQCDGDVPSFSGLSENY
jgi:glucan 1,3-beta-glucosidase